MGQTKPPSRQGLEIEPLASPSRPSLRKWEDDALLLLSQDRSDAFAVLVERHHDQLWGYLSRRLGPDLADDALAELWEIAFRRRHTFDTELGTAIGWLYGIARNVILRARRHGTRSRNLHDRLSVNERRRRPEVDPADRVVDGDSLGRVWEAMDSLPAHERDVVDLVVVEGLSYQSTATRLGLPVGTVRSRLSRAKARLWYEADLDW